MAGGIQVGTTAFDAESKKLDDQTKSARDLLAEQFPGVRMIKRMISKMKIDLVGDDCFGFAPDGGAWFINDKLVAAFESKKQGTKGNACERWWDNAVTAKHINKDVIYVTFCSGGGAEPGEVLDKLRRKATIMMGDGFKFIMSPDGFSQKQIESVMRDVLSEVLSKQ